MTHHFIRAALFHHSIVTIIQCGNIIYLLQFFIVRIYTGHTHTVQAREEAEGEKLKERRFDTKKSQ